jgi:hypothetical protein
MSDDLIHKLREEEKKLVGDLSLTPLFQKLEAVRKLISIYSPDAAGGADSSPGHAYSEGAKRERKAVQKGKGAAILGAVEDYLEKVGRRAKASEISRELIRVGLPPGNANPVGATSAYLSAAKDRFDNKLGEGYGLRKWRSIPKASLKTDELSVEHATE